MSDTQLKSLFDITKNTEEDNKLEFLNTIDNKDQRKVLSPLIDKLDSYKIWSFTATDTNPKEIASRIAGNHVIYGKMMAHQLAISAKKEGFTGPASFAISKLKEKDLPLSYVCNTKNGQEDVFSETALELSVLGYIASEAELENLVPVEGVDEFRMRSELSAIAANLLTKELLEAWDNFLENSDSNFAQLIRFINSRKKGTDETESMANLLASAIGGTDQLFASDVDADEVEQAFADLVKSLDTKWLSHIISNSKDYIMVFEKEIFADLDIKGGLVEFLLDQGHKHQDIIDCLVVRGSAELNENSCLVIADVAQLAGNHLLGQIDDFVRCEKIKNKS